MLCLNDQSPSSLSKLDMDTTATSFPAQQHLEGPWYLRMTATISCTLLKRKLVRRDNSGSSSYLLHSEIEPPSQKESRHSTVHVLDIYIDALYAQFQADFIETQLSFRGTRLGLKGYPTTSGKRAPSGISFLKGRMKQHEL